MATRDIPPPSTREQGMAVELNTINLELVRYIISLEDRLAALETLVQRVDALEEMDSRIIAGTVFDDD